MYSDNPQGLDPILRMLCDRMADRVLRSVAQGRYPFHPGRHPGNDPLGTPQGARGAVAAAFRMTDSLPRFRDVFLLPVFSRLSTVRSSEYLDAELANALEAALVLFGRLVIGETRVSQFQLRDDAVNVVGAWLHKGVATQWLHSPYGP